MPPPIFLVPQRAPLNAYLALPVILVLENNAGLPYRLVGLTNFQLQERAWSTQEMHRNMNRTAIMPLPKKTEGSLRQGQLINNGPDPRCSTWRPFIKLDSSRLHKHAYTQDTYTHTHTQRERERERERERYCNLPR